MNVGFVMLAHKSLHRAALTARVISEAGCPVAIHVDARTDDTAYANLVASLADVPHIKLIPRRVCDWGTWSLVQASMAGAKMVLDDYPKVGHVYLISGACLPIKPIRELREFLAARPQTDFIESVTIGDVPWTKGGLSDERFTLTFPFAWKRNKRLFDLWVDLQRLVRRKRKIPENLVPHMGSQWWCLSRGTLERVFNDPRQSELDRFFKKVWIPDESYLQSLVRLHKTNVESRSLTLSKFDFLGKPHVFYDDHLTLLRQSEAFFARKIWPGANALYRSFLGEEENRSAVLPGSTSRIDRVFSQAVTRRTRGRTGLVMTSRYPGETGEFGLTAAPYSVFHGFDDIFQNFEGWMRENHGTRTHGHLFAKDRVEFFGRQAGYAGALSDNATLRDYDPHAFLRNLVWNTRGEHQSFLFSPRDQQEVCKTLVADPNATISVVTGAWALPLLRSGRSIDELREQAATLQATEAEFLTLLQERRVRARVQIWSLAEFLEHPLDPLQDVIDGLTGVETQPLVQLPKFQSLRGLPQFLQALRNAGMNPHLAGDIKETPVPAPDAPILHEVAR